MGIKAVGRSLIVAVLAAAVLVPAAAASRSAAPRVKLALLPLPKKAIGAAAKPLALAHDSGVVSNAEAANHAVLATGKVLKSLGRITGYALDYGDAYSGKSGITAVETEVDRYRNRSDAKHGLAFWKRDDALIKPLSKSSIVSVTVKSLRLTHLGSARFGEALTISVAGHAPVTIVDAQAADGKYVVAAQTAAGSKAAAMSLASKLLPKIDRRLRLALAGHLHGRPVKLLPRLKAGPPQGGPDLATLALATTDFSQATLADHRYHANQQVLSDYVLDMKPAAPFDTLTQEIEWYASPSSASFQVTWGGVVFTNTLMKLLGAGTTTRTAVDVSSVGDGAQATLLTSTPPTGTPVHIAVVVLVRGHATDLVFASGASPIQSSDVLGLAQGAASRLDAGVTG